MMPTNLLLILLFWAMQVACTLSFKWGSTQDSRQLWGFIAGNLFGVSSTWILIMLYKTMHPNVAFGICMGGMFLVCQLAIALVFKSQISAIQYLGIFAITAGILLIALGRTQPA
jgi:multidrug transporter EmrE-like cation transporter